MEKPYNMKTVKLEEVVDYLSSKVKQNTPVILNQKLVNEWIKDIKAMGE